MKIEPGKFYKTRDGRKVRIYAVDGPNKTYYQVHGAIFCGASWEHESWRIDGMYSDSENCLLHIISEWEEPKPKLKAWISQRNMAVEMSSYEMNTDKYIRAPWLDEP